MAAEAAAAAAADADVELDEVLSGPGGRPDWLAYIALAASADSDDVGVPT
jgi:hypothetical protein